MTDLFLPEGYGDVLVEVPLGPGERLHSDLGASGTERWMNCPGSIRMSKGMPNKSSIFAMEGTCAHALGEKCLVENVECDVFGGMWVDLDGMLFDEMPEIPDGEKRIFYDGLERSARNPTFLIDEFLTSNVNMYLRTVDHYLNWARDTFGVEPQLLIEKGFSLNEVWPGMFGTNDVCIFVPGICLIVIDYKHGRGKVVEIKNNTQLRYYGLGGIIELVLRPEDMPKEIVTVVVQPRASHRDGPVRPYAYTAEEINVDYRAELIVAARKTEDPDAELKTGDWCFFCPGKVKCPKIVGKFAKMSKVDHYDLTDEELGMSAPVIVQRGVAAITESPEQIGKFLKFAPIMESMIEAVREFALQEALRGVVITGQKIVHKDTKRKYRDEEEAAEAILAVPGITAADIYAPPKLKPTTGLKKLGKAKFALIEPLLIGDEETPGLIYKPDGDLTLADVDDERPEVVQHAFGDLDASDLMLPAPDETDFDIL